MTEGHNILVDPSNLKKGDNIGKGAFATVYKAKLKRVTDEVCVTLNEVHEVLADILPRVCSSLSDPKQYLKL